MGHPWSCHFHRQRIRPCPALCFSSVDTHRLQRSRKYRRQLQLAETTHHTLHSQVYFPELFGPLLRTLIHLTSPSSGPPVKIVISYKIRSLLKETPFWIAFGLWFSFQPVLARRRVRPFERSILNAPPGNKPDASEPWRQLGANEDADRTFVFVAYRRPESIAWPILNTDKELMEGIGARNTVKKKGDDTFETILFMAMGIDNTSE